VPARLIRFDEFSLDCDRYELLRAGRPVKLEKNPMELLILLATKNGHLVTRQEIIERLWGKDVFVDTEHGINTAIRKIRFALRDDPENPRFVQTVTGRGYRFLGEPRNGARDAETSPNPQQYAAESVGLKPAQDRGAGGWIWVGTGLVVATLVVGIVFALNLGGVRDRVLANSRVGPIHSIAVLPLANLSGDPAQDYFADGMTDEVITMLAKNTSLGVVSRTSTMQYKSAKRPLREIGRELGADAILEGSVERSGDRVHMTMQLIHAPSDTHIWAESYDRNFNEAFSLPLELSQTVAKTLKVSVAPAASPRYINPEAHDEYLRGHYLWYSMDNENSRTHFERAIQLQPEYAAAWSGVADDYIASVVEGLAPPEPSKIGRASCRERV